MLEESTFLMSSASSWITKALSNNSHASTRHNKMEWLKEKNKHIAKIARALMSKKEMPQSFWTEAVHTAVCIIYRTPIAAIHDITLEQ